jgi:hypothetical protein
VLYVEWSHRESNDNCDDQAQAQLAQMPDSRRLRLETT